MGTREEVLGLRLHARSWTGNRGRPVVLVHGLVVSSRMVVPLAGRLAPRFSVWAPDLPGFGRSHGQAPALDVGGCAQALAGWMRDTGLRRAAIVGNSFGCQVVAELALRWPDLVDRVALGAPTMDPAGRSVPEQLRRWRAELRTQSLRLRGIQVRDYAGAGLGSALRKFGHALEDRIEEKLPYLDLPALVVRGTRDPIVPQRWAEEAVSLLPAGRLAVLPGAPHALAHDSPLEFARVLRPFLAS